MARQNRRDRWEAAVVKSALHPTTRLFLATVLVKHMRSNGFVSVPCKVLARKFGVTERRVLGHIQKAKEGGWLIVVNPGYRGRTAEYEASFPDAERVTPAVTLSMGQKGDADKHPFRVTSSSPFPAQDEERKGDACCHPKDSYLVTTSPESVIYPRNADGPEIDLDDSQIKIKTGTTHLRVVNG